MICVGLVVGAEDLKPITWRVWAGKVEREGGGGGPFHGLEDRLGFVDIRVGSITAVREQDFVTMVPSSAWEWTLRFSIANTFLLSLQAKRKEFADWVRDQDGDNQR